jgi:hypothetical protein
MVNITYRSRSGIRNWGKKNETLKELNWRQRLFYMTISIIHEQMPQRTRLLSSIGEGDADRIVNFTGCCAHENWYQEDVKRTRRNKNKEHGTPVIATLIASLHLSWDGWGWKAPVIDWTPTHGTSFQFSESMSTPEALDSSALEPWICKVGVQTWYVHRREQTVTCIMRHTVDNHDRSWGDTRTLSIVSWIGSYALNVY